MRNMEMGLWYGICIVEQRNDSLSQLSRATVHRKTDDGWFSETHSLPIFAMVVFFLIFKPCFVWVTTEQVSKHCYYL